MAWASTTSRSGGNHCGANTNDFLTETLIRGPVFKDYPASLKPFYMRVNREERTVAMFRPQAACSARQGLAGGIVREQRIEILVESGYEQYLELRKAGGAPHAGLGLGFKRLVSWPSGIDDIRECIPMPRWAGCSCEVRLMQYSATVVMTKLDLQILASFGWAHWQLYKTTTNSTCPYDYISASRPAKSVSLFQRETVQLRPRAPLFDRMAKMWTTFQANRQKDKLARVIEPFSTEKAETKDTGTPGITETRRSSSPSAKRT